MQTEIVNTQDNIKSQRYAWVVILLSAVFLIYKYILQVYPSIITNNLMRAFHVYGAGLGNLAATFFYSYLITQLFVGVLLDKYSPRILSGLAIVIAALGTYIFANAHTITAAHLSRALMGIGAAFATVSYMKLAANWFRATQFAFISGLLATATMLGAIFGQAPLAVLVDHIGWRHALEICAVCGFVIAGLFLLLVRDKPKQPITNIEVKHYQIKWRDILEILSKKQNWIITFYSGLAFAPVAVFGGLWGNPFLQVLHRINRTEAGSLISLVFVGLAIGGPVFGYLSDSVGKCRIFMQVGVLLSLFAAVGVIYAGIGIWFSAIALFLFGFGTGAFMLGFAVGKDLNKAALAATVIALINTGDAIFGATTEPLVGSFLDIGWRGKVLSGVHYFSVQDYHKALIILPIYLLLAFILIFFIKEKAQ